MRCKKARELYFKNRDGLLDEADKMRLQEHLDACAPCTSYASEMDQCLDLLKSCVEMSPSENFEWNLKLRIVREKARLGLGGAGNAFFDFRWGLKFVTSAAVVAFVVLAGVWFTLERDDRGTPAIGTMANNVRTTNVRTSPVSQGYGYIDLTGIGYPAGMRMVSNGALSVDRSLTPSRKMPFQFATQARREALLSENELLKKRIESLERENLMLRRLLSQVRSRH